MEEQLVLLPHMQRTYLIQRLNRPINYNNPFAFGGGLQNGSLSEKAMDLLRPIFSFDYMGAAQFEFGAVPAALGFIHEQAHQGLLVSGVHRDVFYIAPTSYEEGVKQTIGQLLDDERSMRLAGRCGLAESLQEPETPRNVGWLELDNGFFLFIDQEMFEKTKQLFNV